MFQGEEDQRRRRRSKWELLLFCGFSTEEEEEENECQKSRKERFPFPSALLNCKLQSVTGGRGGERGFGNQNQKAWELSDFIHKFHRVVSVFFRFFSVFLLILWWVLQAEKKNKWNFLKKWCRGKSGRTEKTMSDEG